nr:immunoglobulin light chain junction region [Macaca mulatta]MOW39136.1 immunoglobulin light chain junction region [Macaca mulatta]MOW39222.1 immunoglobulin light chain junction region [Macaca mulatta]MOW39237.1 immunoglobulin light chain junction region [Macaca mulatta]MOW39249.1 immunoglobulin light chain junction region [Macaca mulatta]
CQQNNTWNTF